MIGPTFKLPQINTGPFSFGKRSGQEKPLDFLPWLEQVTPTWTWRWKYQLYIQQYLDKITSGEIDRLMLFIPPRHGKSEMVTVRYPAWRLERDPNLPVIVGAYNQILANKFSRKTRRICKERIDLSRERYAVEDWQTEAGGGVRAIGVGGGITGQGGGLIIIDDPVKNREEANSEAYRERCYDWYKDDLYTRQEPGCAIILIMTRWHEDDLAGRILASEEGPEWTVVSLPALAEDNDPLGRQPGQALCPERYDEKKLERIKRVEGRSWWALYQQRPQEMEGDFFKASWFSIVHALPANCQFLRYWDKAGSQGKGDYTAGVLIARASDGNFIVVDVVRGQWAAGEREKIIRQTAELDKQAHGRVTIWVEEEGGSGGKESAEATIRNLAGFSVHTEHPTGSKEVRAEPFQAQAQVGNVNIMAGDWNNEYLVELCSFPNAAHDDQVDATSGAFNKLTGVNGWGEWVAEQLKKIKEPQPQEIEDAG